MLALRGLTVLSKFLLIFVLTKKGSLSLQGEYTLILTTVSLVNLVLGFEIYNITNRQLAGKTLKHKDFYYLFANHFVSILVTYAFFSGLYFLFFSTLIPTENLTLILIILIFDHLNIEIFRLLLALKKQYLAYVLNFIKQGLWAIIIACLFFFSITEVSLESTLLMWSVFSVLSFILFLFFIPKINNLTKVKLELKFLFKNIRKAKWLIMCLIPYKVIELSDRYIIESYLGAEALGTYALIFQVLNAVNIIIYTIVITNVYSDIIYFSKTSMEHNLKAKYLSSVRVIKRIYIYTVPLAYVALIIVFKTLLIQIEPYHIIATVLLTIASYFFNAGILKKLVYIGNNNFKEIFNKTLISSIVFLIFAIVLIPPTGIVGAAASQLFGFATFYYLLKNDFQ